MSERGHSHLERLRQLIELQYQARPTGCGDTFGELLCWEIHTNGMMFVWLAEKWGLSLPRSANLFGITAGGSKKNRQ
jgi:hypothetical protein